MNGVRRFFAATNVAVAPSPPPTTAPEPIADPGTSPPKLPPLQTVAQISTTGGKQLYPSPSASSSPIQQTSSPISPETGTIGLFLKKDGPTSPSRQPANPSGSKSVPGLPSNPAPTSLGPRRKPVRSPTPPVASTSSSLINGSSRRPPPTRVVELSKQSVLVLDSEWKKKSSLLNTRDDLLMSLLASEAAVDSRDFQILSAEEVEELKREQQLLSSRLVAMRKKLALETKIRDAALSLQKLQTVKRLSKQTSEQIEAGNRKVDVTTKELSKLQERSSDIERRLLEHRAGVLSYSVRNLEAKLSPGNTNSDSTDDTSFSGSGVASHEMHSPTSSVTSMSTRTKFQGAHLFAGHADSIVPGGSRKVSNSAQITNMEEKIKATEESLEAAQAKNSELENEVKLLALEKSDIEIKFSLDLQIAEETISKLENEMAELENQNTDREDWDREREILEKDLRDHASMLEQLQIKVQELEAAAVTSNNLAMDTLAKDEEIRRLLEDADRQREQWMKERSEIEQEAQAEIQQVREELRDVRLATEQLDAGRDALRSVVRSHKIPTSPSDNSFPSLASSLGTYMTTLQMRLEQSEQEKADLEALRRKHEEDVRSWFEVRERLGREIEEARREREEARKDVRLLETRIKEQSDRNIETANIRASAPLPATDGKHPEDSSNILSSLRGLWAVLPSVEARASKLSKNSSLSPGSPGTPSLSDLDVRALKSLYDPKSGFNSPTVSGEFTIDQFVIRVQALIADDRALVERLIRFSQSHDLLRNNAERAQKLAQDSNKGLEMYQAQVKALEERNAALNRKQLSLLDENNALQQSVEMVLQEKRDLEVQTVEQSDTVRSLTEANNKLSARALAFAEEAAAAPNALKAKLEAQLTEVRSKLEEAQEEIERMRSSESTQRVALLDELNSLQQENGKLRDQLRAKK